MKKIFAIAIIGLTLASCKKSSSGIGSNGVQATIGNNSYVFTVLTSAIVTDSGRSIEIDATSGTNTTTAHTISLSLGSDKAIHTGTYSDTSNYNPPASYNNAGIDFDLYTNPYNTPSDFYNAGLVSSPVTITITAISTTSIQGTFQGTIYLYGDSTNLKQTVSNGRFTANLIKNY